MMDAAPMLDHHQEDPNLGARLNETPSTLTRLVEKHWDLVRRYRLLKKGIDRAARVQQSLFPLESPMLSGYQFDHLYVPCEAVGGDFYDFVECGEGLVLIVSDVIGHGFEAALATMLMKEIFEETATVTKEPIEMLGKMNARLHRILPEGMFAAAAIVKIGAELSEVLFANAGLPYPFVIRASERRVEKVELAGFPLGLFNGDSLPNFEARALSLMPGDVLLLGSDGIHAIAGSEDDSFDSDRVHAILIQLIGRSGGEIIDGLLEEACFGNREPIPDDVNLLAITRSR